MNIHLGYFIGFLISFIIFRAFKPHNKEKKNYKEDFACLIAELEAKAWSQEEKYKRAQETFARMKARYDSMNDALVEAGHCPYGEIYSDENGFIIAYGGMMIPQHEWDKSERGQLYRKFHLERKQKEKNNV